MLKRIVSLALVGAMAFSLAACNTQSSDDDANTKTVIDLADREVKVPLDPQRIAAVPGPTYEMVYMLGSADKIAIVKSGHTTNYPLALLTNPNLANFAGVAANPSSTVNIEDYLSRDIDLVLYYENELELKKFETVDMAAAVVSSTAAEAETVDEALSISFDEYLQSVYEPVELLATILGTEEAQSEYEAWKLYTEEILTLVYDRTSTLSEEEKPSVYWGNTWGEEIRSSYTLTTRIYPINLAGGRLVGPTEGTSFPEVTAEQLYVWDPDVILVDNHGGSPDLVINSMYRENSKWSELQAVQNEQLHRIPAGIFFMDKGTTLSLFTLWTAKSLHPDLFADIDLRVEFQRYYKEFYEFDLSLEQAQNIIDGWFVDVDGDNA